MSSPIKNESPVKKDNEGIELKDLSQDSQNSKSHSKATPSKS